MITGKRTIVGILAHVDAGKTTLTEALLYHSGEISKQGRVDHGDTYFDFESIERNRGITVSSKQADFKIEDRVFTLIDTPGHADLSAEMERTLQVLDLAIIVVSAVDGVQSHTATIFKLLEKYNVPAIIYINKNDRPNVNKEKTMENLNELDDRCVEFETGELSKSFIEQLAMQDEDLLDQLLEGNTEKSFWYDAAQKMLAQRKIFPCIWGSALTGDGIDAVTNILENLTVPVEYPEETGARVYKIMHDDKGQRMTLLKILGGTLHVKDTVYCNGSDGEKINQLLRLNGGKFEAVNEVTAGDVCTAIGLEHGALGDILVTDVKHTELFPESKVQTLQPVMEVSLKLPEDIDVFTAMKTLRQLEAEEPEIGLRTSKESGDIHMKIMGTIHMEVLKEKIKDKYGLDIKFGPPVILYKETIEESMIGYGHFEPLGHYAEVQIRIEPGRRSQGIVTKNKAHTDELKIQFQKLIMTHIKEKEHLGVLTGAPLTDVTITLMTAKTALRETQGGDLRQATYRAIRQGLMKAKSVLLEPWYAFEITLPADAAGRAMSDVQRYYGVSGDMEQLGDDRVLLKGQVPVATFIDYPIKLASYTKGEGSIALQSAGYRACHNQSEVINNLDYKPENDLENTPNSIYFKKGAGYEVKWYDIDEVRHIK